ncbi:MAG: hypothetical protein FVQ81_10325 [Candidatus Glassbacteria bacterium]|nr:hypothetical protein [Candidatus Glassbacteria bacterium]
MRVSVFMCNGFLCKRYRAHSADLPSHMKIAVFTGVVILCLALGAAGVYAQGGPPMLTDDPGTPGDGRLEINLAVTVEKNRGEHLLESPLLDINYGLGDRLQLKFEVPWLLLKNEGGKTKNGLGNSTLGVKWRFIDREDHGVDISTYPQFEFNNPTSSARRGLVEDGSEFLLPLEVAGELGPLSVNGELGYAFLSSGEDELLFGLALGHEFSERLELMGEIYGTSTTGFDESEWVFNLGARFETHQGFTLLASGGRSLGGGASGGSDLLLYLGAQFIF